MWQFSNREIATGIWIIIFLIWVATQKKLRIQLLDVCVSLFTPKLACLYLIGIAWLIGIVILLKSVGFWGIENLKDTILWAVLAGSVLLFRGISHKSDENYVKAIIFDSFRVIVVMEFILNAYTFPLVGELFFVFFMTVLFIFIAVAETDSKFEIARKNLNLIQMLAGWVILIWVGKSVFNDPETAFSTASFRSFSLPILLTILFLPISYFVGVFGAYEDLFIALKFGPKKDAALIKKAKFRLFWKFKINRIRISRASRSLRLPLMNLTSEDDIREILKLES